MSLVLLPKNTARLGGENSWWCVVHAAAGCADALWVAAAFKWLPRKGMYLEDPLQMLLDGAGGARSANTVLLSLFRDEGSGWQILAKMSCRWQMLWRPTNPGIHFHPSDPADRFVFDKLVVFC